MFEEKNSLLSHLGVVEINKYSHLGLQLRTLLPIALFLSFIIQYSRELISEAKKCLMR